MKKTLLLTLALGLAGATSLVAGNVDVYITGSTAFRANVYNACQKLFTTGTGTPALLRRHGAWRRLLRLQPQDGCLGHDRNADRRTHGPSATR